MNSGSGGGEPLTEATEGRNSVAAVRGLPHGAAAGNAGLQPRPQR